MSIHPRHGRATRAVTAVLAALLLAALFSTVQSEPAGAAVSGAFTKTKPMANQRSNHAAVRLNDGRILVTGGYPNTRSAELYTPSTKSWKAAASMKDIRGGHTATLLKDGRVLVVGGFSGLNTAEIYNPATNTWTRTGSMSYARYDHSATLLGNGKVLIAGGWGDSTSLYTSEVFDPSSGTFGSVSYLNYYRAEHGAAAVSSTKVLVAGTNYYYSSDSSVFRSAEVYNQSTNAWNLVGQMGVGRKRGATATSLGGGKVLIAGGLTDGYELTTATEVFDSATNSFSFTGDLNHTRYEHEATKLNDGRVLASGGWDSDGTAEIYDPTSGEWQLTGSLVQERSIHTATYMGSGKVLLAGGYSDSGPVDSAEIFDPARTAVADEKVTPKVAWSGSISLVVWQDSRNGNPDIYGARVSASGAVIDVGGFPISEAAGEQTQPTVAWNGTEFLVAWTDRRSGDATDIYSTRVSTSGVVASPNGKVLSSAANDQSFPTARAHKDGDWLVVWQDGRSGTSTDIYGTRVTKAGAVSNPSGLAISTAVRDQRRPSLAASGSTWLVVWSDRRPANGNSDVYSTRVSTTGAVVNPSGVKVSSAAGDQSNPSVAFNGTTFFVVWSDYRSASSLDVYGSRVNAFGTTVDSAGIAISKRTGVSEASPSLTAIGNTFLVAWQDDRAGSADIFSTRVTDAGSVLSPSGVKVSGAANDQSTPAVGLNNNFYFVVWGDTRTGAESDIYAARVRTDGSVYTPSDGFRIAG